VLSISERLSVRIDTSAIAVKSMRSADSSGLHRLEAVVGLVACPVTAVGVSAEVGSPAWAL
jgi:hypothetical protein